VEKYFLTYDYSVFGRFLFFLLDIPIFASLKILMDEFHKQKNTWQ